MQVLATLRARNVLFALLGAFFALQVVDIVTTTEVLNGGGVELNPIAARLYEAWGVFGLIAPKIVGLGFLAGVMISLHLYVRAKQSDMMPLVFGSEIGVLSAGIVWGVFTAWNNIGVIA